MPLEKKQINQTIVAIFKQQNVKFLTTRNLRKFFSEKVYKNERRPFWNDYKCKNPNQFFKTYATGEQGCLVNSNLGDHGHELWTLKTEFQSGPKDSVTLRVSQNNNSSHTVNHHTPINATSFLTEKFFSNHPVSDSISFSDHQGNQTPDTVTAATVESEKSDYQNKITLPMSPSSQSTKSFNPENLPPPCFEKSKSEVTSTSTTAGASSTKMFTPNKKAKPFKPFVVYGTGPPLLDKHGKPVLPMPKPRSRNFVVVGTGPPLEGLFPNSPFKTGYKKPESERPKDWVTVPEPKARRPQNWDITPESKTEKSQGWITIPKDKKSSKLQDWSVIREPSPQRPQNWESVPETKTPESNRPQDWVTLPETITPTKLTTEECQKPKKATPTPTSPLKPDLELKTQVLIDILNSSPDYCLPTKDLRKRYAKIVYNDVKFNFWKKFSDPSSLFRNLGTDFMTKKIVNGVERFYLVDKYKYWTQLPKPAQEQVWLPDSAVTQPNEPPKVPSRQNSPIFHPNSTPSSLTPPNANLSLKINSDHNQDSANFSGEINSDNKLSDENLGNSGTGLAMKNIFSAISQELGEGDVMPPSTTELKNRIREMQVSPIQPRVKSKDASGKPDRVANLIARSVLAQNLLTRAWEG